MYNKGKMSHSNLSKTLFALSMEVSLFWLGGSFLNTYRYPVVGAIYEILWLPNLAMLFGLPLVSLFFLVKEKKKLQSLYLYSLLILSITILILITNQ